MMCETLVSVARKAFKHDAANGALCRVCSHAGVAVRAAARGSGNVRRELQRDVARQLVRGCGVLHERVQPQAARTASAGDHARAAQRKLGARRGCNPSARLSARRRWRRMHRVAGKPCAPWAPPVGVASALARALDANAQRRSRPVLRRRQRLPAVRNNTRLRHMACSARPDSFEPCSDSRLRQQRRAQRQLQAEEGDRECSDAGTTTAACVTSAAGSSTTRRTLRCTGTKRSSSSRRAPSRRRRAARAGLYCQSPGLRSC